MASIDTGPSVRVEVTRLLPEEWAGRNIAGRLGTYDSLPDWESIREDFGGGKYRLVIKAPDSHGRMTYRGCRTLQVAGDPLVPQDAPLATSKVQRDQLRAEIERAIEARVESRLAALEGELRRLRAKVAA